MYSPRSISPGISRDTWPFDVMPMTARPITIVDAISAKVDFTGASRLEISTSSDPDTDTVPAKAIAQKQISRTLIIEFMPPRSSRRVTSSMTESAWKPLLPTMSTLKPFTEATTEFEKDTPWNTTALNMAVAHDTSMTGTVGIFMTEPTRTTRTGTSRSRFQLNAESRVERIVPTFSGTVPPED